MSTSILAPRTPKYRVVRVDGRWAIVDRKGAACLFWRCRWAAEACIEEGAWLCQKSARVPLTVGQRVRFFLSQFFMTAHPA